MNVTVTIDEPGFLQSIKECFQQVKVPCQTAMAEAFRDVVYANLGDDGQQDKPVWDLLSKPYAKRVGRTEATLRLTPEEAKRVKGDPNLLYDSTGINVTNPEFATVYNNCKYAEVHQETRRFFPVIGDEVTPITKDICVAACERVLEERLK